MAKPRLPIGSDAGGAVLKRSLLASGVVRAEQLAQNNIVFLTPKGRTRFAPIGMDRRLSEDRLKFFVGSYDKPLSLQKGENK